MNEKTSENDSTKAGIARAREEQVRKRAYELYLARKGGPR
jgi:hypothetical protein